LQDENAKNNEKINEIKIANLGLEKEVGGFRFIAEAFGMELKNVVKFFIFLIVIVFDPLAIALIIAFNGLIGVKKKNREEIIGEMVENNQKMGLYEVYGDKNVQIEEEPPIIVENTNIVEEIEEPKEMGPTPKNAWEEPGFDWENRSSWVNNPAAVRYWMKNGGSIAKYNSIFRKYIKNDIDNDELTKTY